MSKTKKMLITLAIFALTGTASTLKVYADQDQHVKDYQAYLDKLQRMWDQMEQSGEGEPSDSDDIGECSMDVICG